MFSNCNAFLLLSQIFSSKFCCRFCEDRWKFKLKIVHCSRGTNTNGHQFARNRGSHCGSWIKRRIRCSDCWIGPSDSVEAKQLNEAGVSVVALDQENWAVPGDCPVDRELFELARGSNGIFQPIFEMVSATSPSNLKKVKLSR